MHVLGIETSGSACSVGLVNEDGVLAERMVRGLRQHSVCLMDLVATVLEDGGRGLADLGGLAVGLGPGSFTGLRIGVAVVRTLAQVWRIPALGVGTLDALAYPLAGHAGVVCVLVTARHNEDYVGLYRNGEDGLERVFGPAALQPDAAVKQLQEREETVVLVGDAAPRYYREWEGKFKDRLTLAPASLHFPRGAVVAEMALARLRRGEAGDPLLLLPVYVNPPAVRLPARG